MYHLVFVTEGARDATSPDIAVYNTFVNDEADQVPELGGFTWFAIASTQLVDARDNAPVSAPVYRLDGTKVADGFADIWDGDIDSPILINQFGGLEEQSVWTGTDANGLAAGALGNVGFGAVIGSSVRADQSWVFDAITETKRLSFPLYALSAKLTVPIPEPSSKALSWLALVWTAMAYGWQCARRPTVSSDLLQQPTALTGTSPRANRRC
jgi:hypothetical protein